MRAKITARNSLYSDVKRGSIGEVVDRKYINTTLEVWRVLFPSGGSRLFYPDEVELIDDEQ